MLKLGEGETDGHHAPLLIDQIFTGLQINGVHTADGHLKPRCDAIGIVTLVDDRILRDGYFQYLELCDFLHIRDVDDRFVCNMIFLFRTIKAALIVELIGLLRCGVLRIRKGSLRCLEPSGDRAFVAEYSRDDKGSGYGHQTDQEAYLCDLLFVFRFVVPSSEYPEHHATPLSSSNTTVMVFLSMLTCPASISIFRMAALRACSIRAG